MVNSSNSAQGLFFIRAIVLSTIVLGIVASLTAARAADEKGGLNIAMVNPGKLLSDYKYAKQSRETLEKLDGEAKTAINTWNRYPLLSTQDQDALVKLIIKEATPNTTLTKAETDQKTSLTTKHDSLFKEYNDLLAKPVGATTAQDSLRLEALNKYRSDTDIRIKDKQKTAGEDISKKEEEFNVKIDKDVRDALNKVAKEQKLNLVFSSQVVLFADKDITDDVLKQLNK